MTAALDSQTLPAPIHILVVDDNPGDARLIIRSLEGIKVPITVSTVRDGDEALAFLKQEGAYSGAGATDLVLLDLNMPKKGGFDVLTAMRNDPVLNVIPVIILTSSEAQEDIQRSYKLHANSYVVKPFSLEHYASVASAIEDFWLRRARLPQVEWN